MREIKFRAWDKRLQIWADDEMAISEGGGLIAGIRGEYTNPVSRNDFIVEQYTGLKDKTGKEIYEGDIVASPRKGPTMLVIWLDKTASFELMTLEKATEEDPITLMLSQKLPSFCDTSANGTRVTTASLGSFNNCLKVVGNVHETHH